MPPNLFAWSEKVLLPLLIEGDADPLYLAPDDVAGQRIALRHQGELGRDSNRAGDIEGRPGGGDVANGAINRAAAELDLSGFQDPLSVCNPVLIHRIVMLLRLKPGRSQGFRAR